MTEFIIHSGKISSIAVASSRFVVNIPCAHLRDIGIIIHFEFTKVFVGVLKGLNKVTSFLYLTGLRYFLFLAG
jgi:hypothetical protein